MTQRQRRPVRSIQPVPERRLTNSYYDVQTRYVLGGEPAHLVVCGTCAAFVPSGDKAKTRHTQWHVLIQEALDR